MFSLSSQTLIAGGDADSYSSGLYGGDAAAPGVHFIHIPEDYVKDVLKRDLLLHREVHGSRFVSSALKGLFSHLFLTSSQPFSPSQSITLQIQPIAFSTPKFF